MRTYFNDWCLYCLLSGNYEEPDDLTLRLRTAYTLGKWIDLREKLEQIDSSWGTKCKSDSDRCKNLRRTNRRIENEYVYSALNNYDENVENCACDSEASLVTNMTLKVDEIIARISEDDCGGCGRCGDCSIQDLMKESEVQNHDYECQQEGSEMFWKSPYLDLEHCQGKYLSHLT